MSVWYRAECGHCGATWRLEAPDGKRPLSVQCSCSAGSKDIRFTRAAEDGVTYAQLRTMGKK